MTIMLRTYALLLCLAALLAGAGCRRDIQVLSTDEEVQKVKVPAGSRPLHLAMSPLELGYSPSSDLDQDSSRYPAKVDREKAREGLCNAIASYTGYGAPARVEGATYGAAFPEAEKAGATVLIRPVLERLDCVWAGHNGRWVPNMLLFIYAWVPAFWVADEDFAVEGTLALHYYSVASERELYVKRIEIKDDWSLDDFERGWSWTGIITVPSTVNANDWGIVSESLAPLVRFHCEQATVLDVATELPRVLTSEEAARKDATVFAVVVGISRYGGGVSGAAGAQADAAHAEALLTGPLGVPAKNVARLEDDRATYQAAEQLILEHLGRTRPGDTALVYWSGLGTSAATAPSAPAEPMLVPKDVEAKDVAGTCVPLARLRQLLGKIPARHIVVVLDASFEGRRAGGRSLFRGADAPLVTSDDDLARFTGAKDGKDVTLWLAGGPSEDAVEVEGEGRGLMSWLFEEGASGRADEDRNGTVTVRELAEWVEREVTTQAGLDGAAQRPRVYRGGALAGMGDSGARETWLVNAGK